jgi:uncharacterized protein with PIN domain
MTRLLLDAMLGRLATYLRMCGYDAAYALDEGIEADDAVLDWARRDDRTLLTRDRELAARYERTVLLDSREVSDQLAELVEAGFEIELPETPQRCSACNGSLVRVDPDEPTPAYAPAAGGTDVWRCEACGQHYWTGSHWADVAATIDDL